MSAKNRLFIGLLFVLLIIVGLQIRKRLFPRPKVHPVRAAMRSLATGLESYKADHGLYPRGVSLADSAVAMGMKVPQGGQKLLTVPSALTTPVAFLTSLIRNAEGFGDSEALSFAYYPDSAGWLLIWVGPDGDFDITEPARVYDSAEPQPSELLIGGPWTYDPTNGATSSGDMWRTHQ